MTEGVAPVQPDYGSFVREAFIQPIRTVIVVDDEFPTLSALIDREINKPAEQSAWQADDVTRVRNIVNFCRDESRKWMVEINDGQFQPESGIDKAIAHLHQSDLLILDYHLDPANQNDGARAIHILRHLATNDHFNLVVVYTKGYADAAGIIEQVAREIAIGLTCLLPEMNMNAKSLAAANLLVEEWEEDIPNIAERLTDAVDEIAYLKARPMASESRWDDILNLAEMQPLRVVMDEILPQLTDKQRRQILKWSLHKRQQSLLPRLFQGATDEVGYTWGADGINWIRTERLFVTVLGKSNNPAELPEKLAVALEKWNPEPHRLLMSRMRAELDEKGVLTEGEILGNSCLQVGWLEDFLTEEPSARFWKIRNTVTRHWESLGDGIQVKVMDFSRRLADHLLEVGRAEALTRHTSVDPVQKRQEITLRMNSYMCSKPVEGHHLTTGHILRFTEPQQSYWLCLSPACDLVPREKTSGWAGRLKSFVAVMAVELFLDNFEDALSHAYGGNHLFLEIGGINGKVECFSFTPLPVAGVNVAESRVANPKWEQMFAENQGCFNEVKQINMRRISADAGGLFMATSAEAQIVAQLRYEYALNLLQRLGANLSRVGLDFIQPS